VGIARSYQTALGHQQQGEGAPDLLQSDHQRLDHILPRVARHQMQDHFGVAGGLEDGAFPLETAADLHRIDQIAVVNDGQRPHRGLDDDRLGVEQRARAGGRIAGVAYCPLAVEPGKCATTEDVGHMTHTPVEMYPLPVPGDDAGALLAPVLKSVEAQIGEVGRVFVVIDAKDAVHAVL
jgi:hypothetical protein